MYCPNCGLPCGHTVIVSWPCESEGCELTDERCETCAMPGFELPRAGYLDPERHEVDAGGLIECPF